MPPWSRRTGAWTSKRPASVPVPPDWEPVELADLGLPARPAGRIWLLRAPEPYATPQDVLDDIWSSWLASGGRAMATPELVEYADRRLREIF